MRDGFDRVVEEIIDAMPTEGRALVAVDGIGASGKSTFAAVIARRIDHRPTVVLHVDDFFNASAVRHSRGRYSPEGFWLDTYNYDALISGALIPLRSGQQRYRAASFDRRVGQPCVPPLSAAARDAVVIVEGTFLHRDGLAPFWDFSIFLDVGFGEAARRIRSRSAPAGTIDDRLLARYTGAQRIYFSAARPWERASIVVDNTLPDRPNIVDPSTAKAAR